MRHNNNHLTTSNVWWFSAWTHPFGFALGKAKVKACFGALNCNFLINFLSIFILQKQKHFSSIKPCCLYSGWNLWVFLNSWLKLNCLTWDLCPQDKLLSLLVVECRNPCRDGGWAARGSLILSYKQLYLGGGGKFSKVPKWFRIKNLHFIISMLWSQINIFQNVVLSCFLQCYLPQRHPLFLPILFLFFRLAFLLWCDQSWCNCFQRWFLLWDASDWDILQSG